MTTHDYPRRRAAPCRAAWTPPEFLVQSDYAELFRDRVLQAHEGCDFVCFDRHVVPEPEIF